MLLAFGKNGDACAATFFLKKEYPQAFDNTSYSLNRMQVAGFCRQCSISANLVYLKLHSLILLPLHHYVLLALFPKCFFVSATNKAPTKTSFYETPSHICLSSFFDSECECTGKNWGNACGSGRLRCFGIGWW